MQEEQSGHLSPECWVDHSTGITAEPLVHRNECCHFSKSSHHEEDGRSDENVRNHRASGATSSQGRSSADDQASTDGTSNTEHEDLVWLEVTLQLLLLFLSGGIFNVFGRGLVVIDVRHPGFELLSQSSLGDLERRLESMVIQRLMENQNKMGIQDGYGKDEKK